MKYSRRPKKIPEGPVKRYRGGMLRWMAEGSRGKQPTGLDREAQISGIASLMPLIQHGGILVADGPRRRLHI